LVPAIHPASLAAGTNANAQHFHGVPTHLERLVGANPKPPLAPLAPMIRLFVYGTLKRGFALHETGLAGQRFLGAYRTVDPYPMVVAGPSFAPMMLDEPGTGLRVRGELYEVESARIATIDSIEHIGEPGNSRASIELEPIAGGARLAANVYFKARELASPRHTAYLQDYQDRRFIPPWSGEAAR
jgi:gamma-glutamylaminecyclotransferase